MAKYDSVFNPKYADPNEQEGYYLNFWSCDECGEEVIPALASVSETGRYCPNCYEPHDNHDNDYGINSIDDTRITDKRVIQLIKEGKVTNNFKIISPEMIIRIESRKADWRCKFCGATHADEGLPSNLLHCDNCGQYQTSMDDNAAPDRSNSGQTVDYLSGELVDGDRFTKNGETFVPESMVEAKRNLSQQTDQYTQDDAGSYIKRHVPSGRSFQMPSVNISWRGIMWFLLTVSGVTAVFGGGWWLFAPRTIDVEVTQLPWEVTVEVQQLKPVQDSGWDEEAPVGARILSSEYIYRKTIEVQQGTKTIMVPKKYVVKAGYYEKTGTQTCGNAKIGQGVSKRTCTDDKRWVEPVTRTRPEPKVVPNMVPKKVFDDYQTWEIDKWVYEQTLRTNGVDDEPRIPPVARLDNFPYPERALRPVESCKVSGVYYLEDEKKAGTWSLACNQFDLIDTGDNVQLEVNNAGMSTLLLPE